jgi:uncharacterized coiled-coil DUF342 family protein
MNEKRKIYYEKFDSRLDEWGAQIDQLKARSSTIRAEIAQEYDEALEALRAKHTVAMGRLKELKESGDGAWDEMVAGLEKILEEGKATYKNAVARFHS